MDQRLRSAVCGLQFQWYCRRLGLACYGSRVALVRLAGPVSVDLADGPFLRRSGVGKVSMALANER